jgi:hypothetical protein
MPVSFEWVAGGAALMMRQGERPPSATPSATWIIGRDADSEDFTVLYHDSRGVSRVYGMSLIDGVWRMWRNHPTFAQRFEARISQDRTVIEARWEKSKDQAGWEHDFSMRFRR